MTAELLPHPKSTNDARRPADRVDVDTKFEDDFIVASRTEIMLSRQSSISVSRNLQRLSAQSSRVIRKGRLKIVSSTHARPHANEPQGESLVMMHRKWTKDA
jgi:hypothetical protein